VIKFKNSLTIILVLFFFSGCGYRFGQSEGSLLNRSVYVPYIEGDQSGFLTNALIYALSKRPGILYDDRSPDFVVKVCLQPPADTTIGFRYANGNERKVVTSDESRLTFVAEVKVMDCSTGTLVRRCQRVVDSIDYDFESDFSNLGEDTFSLGQLKMYNQARDTAQQSLFRLLAEKIVDSILY
jgi:hypothetical protein